MYVNGSDVVSGVSTFDIFPVDFLIRLLNNPGAYVISIQNWS